MHAVVYRAIKLNKFIKYWMSAGTREQHPLLCEVSVILFFFRLFVLSYSVKKVKT